MYRISLASTFFIFQISAGWAEQSPLERAELDLQTAIESCLVDGHELRFKANPIVTADLGGSNEPEAILDYGAMDCNGDSWLYGGSLGATVDIYSTDTRVSYLTRTGYELVQFDGRWAAKFQMSEAFSVAECNKNCWRYVALIDGLLDEWYR